MSLLDFGDLHYLSQCLAAAIRRRRPSIVTTGWWVIRENHRQGTHQRFTFADYRRMRSRRRPR